MKPTKGKKNSWEMCSRRNRHVFRKQVEKVAEGALSAQIRLVTSLHWWVCKCLICPATTVHLFRTVFVFMASVCLSVSRHILVKTYRDYHRIQIPRFQSILWSSFKDQRIDHGRHRWLNQQQTANQFWSISQHEERFLDGLIESCTRLFFDESKRNLFRRITFE